MVYTVLENVQAGLYFLVGFSRYTSTAAVAVAAATPTSVSISTSISISLSISISFSIAAPTLPLPIFSPKTYSWLPTPILLRPLTHFLDLRVEKDLLLSLHILSFFDFYLPFL